MRVQLQLAAALTAAGVVFSSAAAQATFMPVLDEFWVNKNGVEVFRDSFNDGALPPSGPENALTGTGATYTMTGAAGMVSESGGKLTMDPSLGLAQINPEGNLNIRTEARRQRSTNPASGAFLGLADSFAVNVLYDLSSLPDVAASGFGVRLSDRLNGSPNEGNDLVTLEVARGRNTGTLGILFADVDFGTGNVETFDFIPLDPILLANPTAAQVQLTITKDAGTNVVDGFFSIFDSGGTLLLTMGVDNVGNENLQVASIYDGEDYTRAAFDSRTQVILVPEPGTAAVLALGLAGLGRIRRLRGA